MSSARPLRRASRLALLLLFAAMSALGIALGQTVPGSPIVSDVPVAGGTERVLFLGTKGARALLVLLSGTDGIVGLDSEGGVHQLGGNFLVRTIGQWTAQGFDVVLPDAPNGTDRMDQSARTAPTTAQPAPSRKETLPAASSWRSAQTPLPPASTASSPNSSQQSTPPSIIPRSIPLAFAEVP
jgi:hypothetical protein